MAAKHEAFLTDAAQAAIKELGAQVANPNEDSVGIALERRHQPKRIRKGSDRELDTDF